MFTPTHLFVFQILFNFQVERVNGYRNGRSYDELHTISFNGIVNSCTGIRDLLLCKNNFPLAVTIIKLLQTVLCKST